MRRLLRSALALCLLSAILAPSLPPAAGAPLSSQPVPQEEVWVDPLILEQMAASPDGQAGFFVLFRERADLSAAATIHDWQARGRLVYDLLRATAERSQSHTQDWLRQEGIPFTSFAIDNSLFLTADRSTLEVLRTFPEVSGFRGNHLYELEPPPETSSLPTPSGVVWNISLVGADRVWSEMKVTGQGIVVANIDTGVEYMHDALFPNYRCGNGPHEDCWYDPSRVCPDEAPCDDQGHGTHTMGTMVGDDDPTLAYNVGMAPDAQWIACRGCEAYYCSEYALTACADWVLAPNGDPDKRPHVVNNSWGGGECDTWYQNKVQAWRAAGIFPAFSAGNSGPACNTVGSPGDYPESFASGATDSNDRIASFSSRGPSCFGETKPDVSAPGVEVCSSVPGNGWDCSYSGTSMASPHTAGLVALLWSAKPALVGDIAATERILTSTASCLEDDSCGGAGCPNNVYGWGRIDAYMAVLTVASQGWLVGTAYDAATGDPLPDVAVSARQPGLSPAQTTTDASGHYTFSLPAGTYTVSASLYGYFPLTMTGITLITDTTTTLDLDLQPRPRHILSGTVTDATTGQPLEARIHVEAPFVPPLWTDPASGFYSLTLIEDTYPLQVAAPFHFSRRVTLTLDRDLRADFALQAASCTLLVDDDANRPDVRSYYTSTLDELGVPYQVWDVATQGPPDGLDLLGHWAVFWWTGNAPQTLTSQDETALQSYLDARGNLFLSSNDYLGSSGLGLEKGGPPNPRTPFQQDYLHVFWYSMDSGGNDPVGNSGDPIGEGLGPYLLVPPEGWEGSLNGDGLAHDGTGGVSAPFRWQGYGADNSTDYDGGSFKTVFFAWPLEGLISPVGRRAVLGAVQNFFGACQPTGLLFGRVSDANTGEPLSDVAVAPVPEGEQAEATLQSQTDARGHFTFTLPTGSYELTVYKEGYEPEVISAISIPAGLVTHLEVPLRTPRLGYNPASFSWDLDWQEQVTDTLVLSNIGTAGPLEWTLRVGYRYDRQAAGPPLLPRQAGRAPSDEPPAQLPEGRRVLPAGSTEGWEQETPLPSGRYGSAGFCGPDGSFYVVGGGGIYSCLPDNLRYDPDAGTWTEMTPMPVSLLDMQAAVVDGVAYFPGGYCEGVYQSVLQAYDLASDTWRSDLSPLPEPRSGAMVAAIGDLVYACGGNPGPSDRCWAYAPALDRWEEIAPMPAPLGYGVAIEHDGFLYIVGGVTSQYVVQDVFWRYAPQSDTWEVGPAMQEARMSPAVAVYDQDLYVLSGGGEKDMGVPLSTGERYPLEKWPTGRWETLPDRVPVPVVRSAFSCTGDRIRLAGGYDEWDVSTTHQTLNEDGLCYTSPGGSVLPWLSAEPLSGSLEIGTQQTVTLRADAALVQDIGCYQAGLYLKNNTVYGPDTVPVTMCVHPIPTIGKVRGQVRSLGYCDRYPRPLATTLRLLDTAGTPWTITSGLDGSYFRWLPIGTYSVTVGAAGHMTATTQIEVRSIETTTLDFSLRLLTSCLGIRPLSLVLYAPTGTLVQETLHLTNGGALPLTWQAQESFFPALPTQTHAFGGPDPYGYVYLDSSEPRGPTFDWIEISETGQDLNLYDNSYTFPLDLPFSFNFYGTSYDQIAVSSEGTVYFVDAYLGFTNECIPATPYYSVRDLIAGYWDNLDVGWKGSVYYQSLQYHGYEVAVIEWDDVPHDDTSDGATFEIVLFPDGSILLQYQDAEFGDGLYDWGQSATVGIQALNTDPEYYLEYSCNTTALTNSLAICFEFPDGIPACTDWWGDVPWLTFSPAEGQVPADGEASLVLTIDTTALEPGVQRALIGITSNDAHRRLVFVPVTLIVGLEPQIWLPLLPRAAGP